jgi:transposase
MLAPESFPADLHLRIELITIAPDQMIVLTLASARDGVRCPQCGTTAGRIHSHYRRTIADLPWQGRAVQLRLAVRRFFCDVTDCPRRIFAERFPGLVAPHGRRSDRLRALFEAISLVLGGEGGARLVGALGVCVSPDTLLRILRAQPLTVPPAPRVLGVDDWAKRRGQTYGTILVDLERRQVVDLLPDRSAETLAAWLREHPGIAIISRDRASAYADGARRGAPQAVQVADRWHLLKNVGDALERFLLGQQAALRHAHAAPLATAVTSSAIDRPSQAEEHPAPVQRGRAVPPTPGTVRREARYAQIIALRAAGHSIRAIARQTELSRMTVRKYLRADGCPGPPNRVGMLTTGSGWEQRARALWDEGERNAAALWRALRVEGFPGSAGSIRRHVGRWRAEPGRRGRRPTDGAGRSRAGSAPTPPPSPRQVRWWLLQPVDERTADQLAYLVRLREHHPAVQFAQTVVQEFGRIVRDRDQTAFDGWLTAAATCGIAELAAVATFMRRDYDAIVAALTLPWSNGQTEGQVTRLKLVKRQMYGRGHLDLLKRRLIRPA